jgi:hypothetical protein
MRIYKKITNIVLTLILSLFVMNSINVSADDVVPTDFTTIYTNTNNNITSNIIDDFGVFRFYNYGTRFVEVTLTATSDENIFYPTGSFLVRDSDFHLVKQCEISDYSNYAINYNNTNSLTVFLPASGYYFIEVNFDMIGITKLELSVNVVDTTNTIDLFNYSPSEQFYINIFSNSNKQDKISQFVLKQPAKFTISTTNNSQLTNEYRIVLLKRDTTNVASAFTTLKNVVISADYSYTIDLTEGTYYIGYFASNESNSITISMSRILTSYGSDYLVPDPDKDTLCGSQINLEELDINIHNRSYRQSEITEGFTRLIYLSSDSPSSSRLDYFWYSSNTNIAKITDYGTVLALPISSGTEVVKIMAVYKYDMSKTFTKEFTILNDVETYLSNPIDINVNMVIGTLQYTPIDLSNSNVPINMLQYYSWNILSGGSIDIWGGIIAPNESLGTTLNITGVYLYNPKIKIHVDAFVALPLSGYELEYNTMLWDDEVESNNNCYNYALNNQVHPETNTLWFKQQPGEFAEAMTYDYSDEGKMYNAVLADFEKYNELYGTNLLFQRVGKFQKCPTGTYKVALVANSSNWDYHWYRQDSDGYWSHKPGTSAVTRLDSNGKLIVNPEECGRGIYDVFLGFYAVSGWNNMYDDSTALLSTVLEKITVLKNNNIVTNKQILSLKIGMSYNEVISLLGGKGSDVGSGTLIEKYMTEDENKLIIYYNLFDDGFRVVDILIEGGD